MTQEEARSYLNYLLTLSLRREEAFGPLAMAFIRENDLDALGLTPEEQFNLLMATIQVFAAEPKRYTLKLELLHKAQQLLPKSRYFDQNLSQQVDQEIQKTSAEINIYSEAMRVASPQSLAKQRLVVETDLPEYFLETAQKHAAAYYQQKYRMGKEAKTAQHFGGPPRTFEPDNITIHKEFPGACAPFMAARTNTFHLMLPFDLKISRTPEEPLEAGIRIFYGKIGYSYPLRYEMGKLCSYHDGQVYDIPLNDPHLIFVSVSGVKDPEFKTPVGSSSDVPPEYAYPLAVLKHTGSLGPFIQLSCNFKIWFDSSILSVLIQGTPDLHEYGLQGGSGLMTRTYASDKVETYAEATSQPWQEGLSFNFVNMHLTLSPDTHSAFVPHSTPIFSVYPVLNRQCVKFEDRNTLSN